MKWRLKTEANIQAEFYHQARLINLPVVLEFRTPVGILDVAILNIMRDGIVAIVECKRSQTPKFNSESWQIKRYKRIGVPVYGLADFERAARLAASIKSKHGNKSGVLLTAIPSILRLDWSRRPIAQVINESDADLNLKHNVLYKERAITV